MKGSNGIAIYEVTVGGRKITSKVAKARITDKRVYLPTRTFDHAGKRVSAYRPGMLPMRLLGFRLDGQEYVEVAKPTEAE